MLTNNNSLWYNEYFHCALMVVFSVIFSVSFQLGVNQLIKNNIKETLSEVASVNNFNVRNMEVCVSKNPKMQILKNQYYIAGKYKNYFLEVTKLYYSNYYAFLTCAIVYTIILTICLFLAANMGWQKLSIYTKTLFFISFFFSTLYYLYPTVYSSNSNLEKNETLFKKYRSLQYKTLNYITKCDSLTPDQLDSAIIDINDSISNNFDFIIEFNPNEIKRPSLSGLKKIE